jgi:CBS domain-containing protein
MAKMTGNAARDFRRQLQQAREDALKDAEAFDGIIHVVERLGSFCLGRVAALGNYKSVVMKVARRSPLAHVPTARRNAHTPFSLLYDLVKDARNDVAHQGAAARQLTTHAIQLALVLEDALRIIENAKTVSDYMVRDPVCAHLWQPVSFVRQQMLTNSFSLLPVQDAEGHWCLVSDLQVAKYLQVDTNNERRRRLAKPLGKAKEIRLLTAKPVSDTMLICDALVDFDDKPKLVFRYNGKAELVGILTAFDLL